MKERYFEATLASLFLITVSALVILGLSSPADLWVARFHETPPWIVFPFVGVYLIVTMFYRAKMSGPGRSRNVGLAACLFCIYESCRAAPLGDHLNCWSSARGNLINASEPGANAFYHVVYHALGPDAVCHVGPVLGALTAYLVLSLCDRCFASTGHLHLDSPLQRRACALLYLGCGTHLTFFNGYIENTQPGVPLLVLFLGNLYQYLARDDHGVIGRQAWAHPRLAIATVCLSAACFVHGQGFFLLPVLPLALWIRRLDQGHLRRGIAETLFALGVGLLTLVVLFGVVRGLGLELITGMPLGREDDTWLVPLFRVSSTTGMQFLDTAHLQQTANIALQATPLSLFTPLLVASLLLRRRIPTRPRWLVCLPALGYVGFILLFEFDLGVPVDYDLMLSMGFVLGLAILDPWLRIAGRSSILAVLTLSALLGTTALSWAVMSTFLTSVIAEPEPVDARFGYAKLNGVSSTGVEPTIIKVPPVNGVLEFEMHGPPGALVSLVSGPHDRGRRYWRHVGTSHVGSPPDFLDTAIAFSKVLPADGKLRYSYPYVAGAPGPLLSVQPVFKQPPGSKVPFVFAPGFYVVVDGKTK